MTNSATQRWLDAWGYPRSGDGIHHRNDPIPADHPYRREIQELLNPQEAIRASAVFDVDGVPTICFIEGAEGDDQSAEVLDRIRGKIWNQNLVSVALVVSTEEALALPIGARHLSAERIAWKDRDDSGPYSCRGIQAGELFRRHKEWFAPEHRVDERLLRNLNYIIRKLVELGIGKVDAQYLMAQILFISYLEHRKIVGDRYREKHNLKSLNALIETSDRIGIVSLLVQLKRDFNGDFLEPESKGSSLWKVLPDEAFSELYRFLQQDELESGQKSFWAYDFRYIPVELLSGIYESFLADDAREVGAYYTPRHLANLAVDQAFRESVDILRERVFDGACGSGILLTTAYRRMLSYAQAMAGKTLPFQERRKLLERNIFGSDISDSACRVTAFSLYLSMLEGLEPADISKLQDDCKVKLPNLSKANIIGGKGCGDFFSDKNPLAGGSGFSILLSNPPWIEPGKKEHLSSDVWASDNNHVLPRRQVAAAFMFRARDFLTKSGRICLILPVSLAAAGTSRNFLRDWLTLYEPKRIINFGDIRKLLFSKARSPCMILVAKPRRQVNEHECQVPPFETFEYWAPKADISLAFGRLTLHSQDRHELRTQFLQLSNEAITTLYWGTEQDVAMIGSLRLKGQLGDMFAKDGPWRTRKGYHFRDSAIDRPVSSAPLRELPFLDARRFEADGPLLDHSLLGAFPPEQSTVAALPDYLVAAFREPKIVFTDGITRDRTIKAAFSNQEFTFNSSIGMVSAPAANEDILRFVAAYLHSSLAQYLLVLTAYQVAFERERVSLQNIKSFPFVHPDAHRDPERAWEIVREVANQTRQLESADRLLLGSTDLEECNRLVFDYFCIRKSDRGRIKEVSELVAPNIQPGSVNKLDSPLQQRPSSKHLGTYCQTLRNEINAWSSARGGTGEVSVSLICNSRIVSGPQGIVKITPQARKISGRAKHLSSFDDRAVKALLVKLDNLQLRPIEDGSSFDFLPDVIVDSAGSIFLVKPLVMRFWLRSEAYRDAKEIVSLVVSGTAR